MRSLRNNRGPNISRILSLGLAQSRSAEHLYQLQGIYDSWSFWVVSMLTVAVPRWFYSFSFGFLIGIVLAGGYQ